MVGEWVALAIATLHHRVGLATEHAKLTVVMSAAHLARLLYQGY